MSFLRQNVTPPLSLIVYITFTIFYYLRMCQRRHTLQFEQKNTETKYASKKLNEKRQHDNRMIFIVNWTPFRIICLHFVLEPQFSIYSDPSANQTKMRLKFRQTQSKKRERSLTKLLQQTWNSYLFTLNSILDKF